MVVNAQEILPRRWPPGRKRYPADVSERLSAVTDRLYMVDALAAALSLREVRTVNMVMVGAASRFLRCRKRRTKGPESQPAGADGRGQRRRLRAGRSLLPPAKLRTDVYTVRGGDR